MSDQPTPSQVAADAKTAEDQAAALAQAQLDKTASMEPKLPVEPEPETSEPEEKAPEFIVINEAVKARRVIKISPESQEAPLFIKEWGVQTGFKLIQHVKKIAGLLGDYGVLPKSTEEAKARKDAGITALDQLDGILSVVADCTADVFELVIESTFTEAGADKKSKLTQEAAEELSIGDLVLILRSIFYVNFEVGALKNALAGLVLTK